MLGASAQDSVPTDPPNQSTAKSPSSFSRIQRTEEESQSEQHRPFPPHDLSQSSIKRAHGRQAKEISRTEPRRLLSSATKVLFRELIMAHTRDPARKYEPISTWRFATIVADKAEQKTLSKRKSAHLVSDMAMGEETYAVHKPRHNAHISRNCLFSLTSSSGFFTGEAALVESELDTTSSPVAPYDRSVDLTSRRGR